MLYSLHRETVQRRKWLLGKPWFESASRVRPHGRPKGASHPITLDKEQTTVAGCRMRAKERYPEVGSGGKTPPVVQFVLAVWVSRENGKITFLFSSFGYVALLKGRKMCRVIAETLIVAVFKHGPRLTEVQIHRLTVSQLWFRCCK